MNLFKGIEFANPGFFWLLLFVPLMIGWYIWKNRVLQGTMRMSTIAGFIKVKSSYGVLRHYGIVFRVLALLF